VPQSTFCDMTAVWLPRSCRMAAATARNGSARCCRTIWFRIDMAVQARVTSEPLMAPLVQAQWRTATNRPGRNAGFARRAF
jgi:hypothetical protein